jgi:hypothetical protein
MESLAGREHRVNVYRQVAGAFEQLAASQPVPGFDASAEHEFRIDVRGDLPPRTVPARVPGPGPRSSRRVLQVSDLADSMS